MDILVGNVVRLEPPELFAVLSNDFTRGTRQPYAVVHIATNKTIGMTSFVDISHHDRTFKTDSENTRSQAALR
jgi:RimJ/RimL family protein N-acetyltransferase